MNNSFLVDEKGFYGEFGGAYVPEILYATVENLRREYLPIIDSEDFRKEYAQLLRDYVGRPSPLYFAKRMSERYGCKLYLKREDLNHTGAHKINNTIGQILLAKKMGKKRKIAETGAGQHGVATAIVCALIYGATVEPLNMVTMRTGGISSRPHNRIIVNTRETKRALKENGVEASYAHLIKRYVTKVRQYISAYSTVDNASSIFKTLRYCTRREKPHRCYAKLY